MQNGTPIRTVSELVEAFGGNKAMAEWADRGETAVCNWKDANAIPPGYHLRLWFEVHRRGLNVDLALFGLDDADLPDEFRSLHPPRPSIVREPVLAHR